MAAHPYASLPAERYWRKAVAGVPPFALDPTRPDAFRLTRTERIATAGSCFAQQVARALKQAGYNYYVAERPAADLDPAQAEMEGNFSARYGNIYTTRHLVQLFERAFGWFEPRLSHWRRPDRRFVDPFRPRVKVEGFVSAKAVEDERGTHLAAVRELFTGLDTLVFTLGLTEGWIDKRDGAALPLPPGVAGGEHDPDRYAFVNATVAEMTADMLRFLDGLREVNPKARVILTVSPVPIIATMEERHVLVSNTYTKSALRVVADEVCRARPGVFYFPSYEVVTSPATAGRYYSDNLRAVTDAGIRHVTRLFLAHAQGGAALRPVAALDLGREVEAASEVICDEEMLDA
jgi:hypothetical protein